MSGLWDRIWPPELDGYKNVERAIPCLPGSFPQKCANCGGIEVMMVYVITEGPYLTPKGKAKWLDYPQPGWYVGELQVAPCPVCQQGRMEAYITHNCGLSGADLEVSLLDYRVSGACSGKVQALQVSQDLLALNKNPSGFVTFVGDYGSGKSHLLKGLVNGFRQIRVQCKYASLSGLLASIRERFGEPRGGLQVEEVIEDFRRAKVLCIDEIDKVNLTDWTKETMFRLLDSRSNERDRLLTVLASNASPEDFPPELGYLASRIRGGVLVEVPGPDMRVVMGIAARKDLQRRAQEAREEDNDDIPDIPQTPQLYQPAMQSMRSVAASMAV